MFDEAMSEMKSFDKVSIRNKIVEIKLLKCICICHVCIAIIDVLSNMLSAFTVVTTD